MLRAIQLGVLAPLRETSAIKLRSEIDLPSKMGPADRGSAEAIELSVLAPLRETSAVKRRSI
jgi:hypothetical protein